MDNFMDNISKKMTAQDFINANTTAEAEQSKVYKHQLEEYDRLLQEIKDMQMNHTTDNKSVEALCMEMNHNIVAMTELLQVAAQQIEKNQEFTHSESVKVYRNVQAVVEKQGEKLQENMTKFMESSQDEQIYRMQKSSVSTKFWLILLLIVSCLHLAFDIVQYLGVL